jgi:carbonic anhydrase
MTQGQAPLQCEALVVTCKDFRFQRFFDEWIRDHVGYGNFDRVSFAGGVKNWELIFGAVELAHQLHNIRRVVFINHENCGAYGAESTPERHASDLKDARTATLRRFPHFTVELYYVTLEGSFTRID